MDDIHYLPDPEPGARHAIDTGKSTHEAQDVQDVQDTDDVYVPVTVTTAEGTSVNLATLYPSASSRLTSSPALRQTIEQDISRLQHLPPVKAGTRLHNVLRHFGLEHYSQFAPEGSPERVPTDTLRRLAKQEGTTATFGFPN